MDSTAALRAPNLPRYIAGRFVSALGRQMLSLAVGWQLLERTNSAFALGLIGLIQVIPVIVLALPGGAIIDRTNRRDMLIGSQLLLGATGAALAVVTHFGAPTPLIYALVFLFGIGVAFNSPTSAAFLPQLVPRQALSNANAWMSTAFQLAALFGPVAAGRIVKWRGDPFWVYVAEAATAVFFVAILLTIPRPPTPVAPPRDKQALRAGVRFVFSEKLLLAALTLDLFAVLLGGATALLPIFARDILFVGADGLGWLQAAPALGAMLTALITTRLSPWRRPGRVLLIVVTGFGLSTIGFGLASNFTLAMVALFLTGVFDNISTVIRATLEQAITPDNLRGRVSAVHYVFIGLSNELGEFESGTTAALLGPIGAVLLGGIGTLVVVAVVIFRWPILAAVGPLDELRPSDRTHKPGGDSGSQA